MPEIAIAALERIQPVTSDRTPTAIANGITAGHRYRSRWFVPESCRATSGKTAEPQVTSAARWTGSRLTSLLIKIFLIAKITTTAIRMLRAGPSRLTTTVPNHFAHVRSDGAPRELRG